MILRIYQIVEIAYPGRYDSTSTLGTRILRARHVKIEDVVVYSRAGAHQLRGG